MHRLHVRKVLTLMRENKLYANLKKCIFADSEIAYLICIVDKHDVLPDPENIKAITGAYRYQGTSKFFGLEAYLQNYADMTVYLSRLLKKNEKWVWSTD